MQKCASHVERLISSVLRTLGSECESFEPSRLADGRGLGRMTLGQKVEALVGLDKEMTNVLRQKPSLRFEGRVVGKQDKKLLETISRLRSDFAHGTKKDPTQLSQEEAWKETRDFLLLAKELVDSQLVHVAGQVEKTRSS